MWGIHNEGYQINLYGLVMKNLAHKYTVLGRSYNNIVLKFVSFTNFFLYVVYTCVHVCMRACVCFKMFIKITTNILLKIILLSNEFVLDCGMFVNWLVTYLSILSSESFWSRCLSNSSFFSFVSIHIDMPRR